MQQYFKRFPIHRAYLTIHIGLQDSKAYLIKNRTVPTDFLEDVPEFKESKNKERERKAEAKAVKWLRYNPDHLKVLKSKTKKRWLPVKNKLRPCYRVRVQRTDPREDWLIYIDALNSRVLKSCNNLNLARTRRKPRKPALKAYVFDPSPVIKLGGHEKLLNSKGSLLPEKERVIPLKAYTRVSLTDLDPDSKFMDGKRVTTRLTRKRIKRPTEGNFEILADNPGFSEIMVYFHLNKAIKYVESLGFKGKKSIFKKPLPVNTRATSKDQSWYDPAIKCLGFGGGEIEDAEDADVIIHELGHAIQDAIIPDYGQSPQAQAMGEGFGDYLAASIFFHRKKGKKFIGAVMTWDGIHVHQKDNPRSLRRVDNANLTFLDFREHEGCHHNGQIWSATLWDIFEEIGKEAADRIIIESHYEQNGFTKLSRGARAIIHADKNLYGGKHAKELREIFKRRLIKLT